MQRAQGVRPGVDTVTTGAVTTGSVTTRTCGFVFTTTGRPCANQVADGTPWCRAGHPCASKAVPDGVSSLSAVPERSDGRVPSSRPGGRAPRPGGRTRRATELLRQAMAADDVDQLGLRAEHVLCDGTTAVALLAGPDASPAARAAVVQRFGHVGALLVLGYEERGRARAGDPWSGPRRLRRLDSSARHLELLVEEFARIDARGLYRLLCDIDEDDGFAGDGAGFDAHRWLHATYAVAARDGTPAAHRAYMCALERVMRLVRPLVAS